MKTFLLTTTAFLALTITCKAQWTLTGSNIYPTTLTNNVGIGTTTPNTRLEVDATSVANGPSNALFLLNPSNTINAGAAIVFGGPSNIYSSGSIRGSLYNAVSGGTGKLVLGSRSSGASNDELTLFGGNVGVGTATPVTLLNVAVSSAKATVAGSVASFLSTNDAANAFGLRTMVYGAAAIADRYVTLQTTDYALADGGSLVLQPSTGNVAIGTANAQGYKLAVNGTAIATSMTVKAFANWPDYVFKPTYQLPSLTEVKAYIDKNQHLPGLPAAAEVEKNGLNLGEMNKVLVQKVEELTLYLMEEHKQNKNQQDEINQLKQQLNTLAKLISKN